jgi:hypothetical protein
VTLPAPPTAGAPRLVTDTILAHGKDTGRGTGMAWHGPPGRQLHYEDSGRGDAVLMMPGWGGSIAGLGPLRRDLADGAGHEIHISHGDWLSATALRWLAGH